MYIPPFEIEIEYYLDCHKLHNVRGPAYKLIVYRTTHKIFVIDGVRQKTK